MPATSPPATTLPAIPAVLDHVAIAVERQSDAWPRYVAQLGGRFDFGSPSPGFDFHQLAWRRGMNLEVLSPARIHQNDFLRRFLDHTGPSAHHVTFKVPDLTAAIEAVEARGLRPVGVNRASPDWQEAFLHPKDGPGIVIQLAQPGPDDHDGHDAPDGHADDDGWGVAPEEFPAPAPVAAELLHAALAVASIERELDVFVGLLSGRIEATGSDDALGARWTQLAWPGPGRIRLLQPADDDAGEALRTWLGDRRGRLHHVAFAGASVPDGVPLAGDPTRLEVVPEANLGVRLVLTPAP